MSDPQTLAPGRHGRPPPPRRAAATSVQGMREPPSPGECPGQQQEPVTCTHMQSRVNRAGLRPEEDTVETGRPREGWDNPCAQMTGFSGGSAAPHLVPTAGHTVGPCCPLHHLGLLQPTLQTCRGAWTGEGDGSGSSPAEDSQGPEAHSKVVPTVLNKGRARWKPHRPPDLAQWPGARLSTHLGASRVLLRPPAPSHHPHL